MFVYLKQIEDDSIIFRLLGLHCCQSFFNMLTSFIPLPMDIFLFHAISLLFFSTTPYASTNPQHIFSLYRPVTYIHQKVFHLHLDAAPFYKSGYASKFFHQLFVYDSTELPTRFFILSIMKNAWRSSTRSIKDCWWISCSNKSILYNVLSLTARVNGVKKSKNPSYRNY